MINTQYYLVNNVNDLLVGEEEEVTLSIKDKIRSDRGAMNSTETIMLIALSIFMVLVIYDKIIKPLVTTSAGIGDSIKEMNPK